MGNASRMIFTDAEMQLTRKLTQRKGYAVAATEYMDSRFTKVKETA
jgi:hypothetical protein